MHDVGSSGGLGSRSAFWGWVGRGRVALFREVLGGVNREGRRIFERLRS